MVSLSVGLRIVPLVRGMRVGFLFLEFFQFHLDVLMYERFNVAVRRKEK